MDASAGFEEPPSEGPSTAFPDAGSQLGVSGAGREGGADRGVGGVGTESEEAVDPARLPAVATTPPRSARRRPRWAVPALAVLLVLAVVAAIGLLVLGPRIVAAPPSGPPVAGLVVVPVPGAAGVAPRAAAVP